MLVHGGPQGAFRDAWSFRWNPQVYAGAGYAVILVNFHGSTGYGQAFVDSIRGAWGESTLADMLAALEAAVATFPWMDGSRVCALGGSYGGYMMNWINGCSTRFRCLVNHAGMFDARSFYFSTEELWFPECDLRGTPWTAPETYEKLSPALRCDRWATPTLVLHGGRDFRVSETEALGTFTALQRRGVPSRLVYFPHEGHWVLRSANSIKWHEEVLAWINKYTKDV
jgi:dipeptidyl aminopeptidase/acylaminoacyl peptidase